MPTSWSSCSSRPPWLRAATAAIPGEDYEPDSVLIVWVLAWVAHALVTYPRQLMSPPINFPAPLQLTTTEHFGSVQLLFAPIFWSTRNAVLAANVVAFLSYPLAAFAMQRLLMVLGCRGTVAWVAGLLFALGPLRVPATLHLIQYANVFLPLVALAVVRLAQRPTTDRAGRLGIAFLLGFFSSYYTTVLVALVAGVWVVHEVVRTRAPRRFVVLASAAGTGALLLLAVASLPYFQQAELFDRTSQFSSQGVEALLEGLGLSHTLANANVRAALTLLLPRFGETPWWQLCWGPATMPFIALGVIGACARADGAVRAIAVLGLVFGVIGAVLMLGPRLIFAGHVIPLPFGVLASSPARFFRVFTRFAVVVGFGTALLAGAGLEHACRRIVAPSARAALLAIAVGLLLAVGVHLCDNRLLHIRAAGRDAGVYDRVGTTVRRFGEGPLAEMPPLEYRPFAAAAERRVGSTRHWLPSICDHSGFPSEHSLVVQTALMQLPDDGALADLVDMTHLRWLLLRPKEEWLNEGGRDRFLATLRARGAVSKVVSVDGWGLVQLAREPRHPEWFAAVAAGGRPGTTVLGTPLEALAPSAAVGRLALASPPAEVMAGTVTPIRVWVTNLGDATWPAALPLIGRDRLVVLTARWVPRDSGEPAPTVQTFRLRRDVPPGETLHDEIALRVPARPGPHDLALEQIGGTAFTGPDGGRLRLTTMVR